MELYHLKWQSFFEKYFFNREIVIDIEKSE